MAGEERSDSVDETIARDPAFLTIDDQNYNLADVPDEIKVLVSDLLRVNQELADLQYRVRHAQAAQQTYVATIKQEIERLGVPSSSAEASAWTSKTA